MLGGRLLVRIASRSSKSKTRIVSKQGVLYRPFQQPARTFVATSIARVKEFEERTGHDASR
jgi:hypothetical protein